MKYGSIPAGGIGSRMQPLGFSKELLPVNGKAVIEHLIERMIFSGIDKIFINTSEEKTDLISYLAKKSIYAENCIFIIRKRRGLLDAITLPIQYLQNNDVLYFGLPDTIWFPKDCFTQLDQIDDSVVLGLFDSGTPEKFDSVITAPDGRILSIDVKVKNPRSKWSWGIGKIRVEEVKSIFHALGDHKEEVLMGEALHIYAQNHRIYGMKIEQSSYLDIGTPQDYAKVEKFISQKRIVK